MPGSACTASPDDPSVPPFLSEAVPSSFVSTDGQNRSRRDCEGDIRAALRRLADSDSRRTIEEANAAVEDLDTAVEFVESVGIPELERAIERAEDPTRRTRGKDALRAFRRFQRAAAGDLDTEYHFHRGRGTDLRRGDEPSSQ
jgi:hypothetical protein